VLFQDDGDREDFVARCLVTELGFSLARAAHHLGGATGAISKMLRRMDAQVNEGNNVPQYGEFTTCL
jgi:hypothetical protein